MNDNLRMLHCVVCLARIQAGDSLCYCSEQTDITLRDHLGLVIFQSPLFPDEVGHHAEFQRSLIN